LSERIVAALVALAVIGCALLTNRAFRQRQIMRKVSERVEGAGRYVDAGVIIKTVVADPKGDIALEGKLGSIRLRVVGEPVAFGGLIDTHSVPPRIVGPSKAPRVWYCSPEQAQIVLHDDPAQLGQLVHGSEGAGKTRALAMWHYVRWITQIGEGRHGGQTAPTIKRMDMVRDEMRALYGADWYRYRTDETRFVMCDGSRIQLVSTAPRPDKQGSPVQGYSWSWCGRDEGQDQLDVHEDIQARGRSAKDGRYWQVITATAKDDSDWRALRDMLIESGHWVRRELSIFRSPFVSPAYISAQEKVVSPREFRRRFGDPKTGKVDDLPPELAVYPAWDREQNLIPIPELGWHDVTAQELAPWGANLQALIGHDPGTLFDVSLVLKAYRGSRDRRPRWFVVDEVTTEQTTTEQHVATLLDRMRGHWGLNLLDRHNRPVQDGPRFMVRADPYGNNDTKPDRSCYTVFRQSGILLHPAAYSQADTTKPGRVPKREGIDMVNTLLCNAASERRLFIARNPDGRPAAPQLVKAIETSEKNERGEAETEKKNRKDLSHWPASLRYALWAIERPRLIAIAGGQP
jgi:hypothetical protein